MPEPVATPPFRAASEARDDRASGNRRVGDATRSIIIGALLGVTWAAGFRGFMAEIAGVASTFGWYPTFVVVLGGGGIVGGLLGWADHIRRTGGRPHWRWLALSPLILGLLPLTVPGALAALSQGIGTAGMAVALIAIGLGYAFGGRRTWLRVVTGLASGGAAVALVAFTPMISEGRISFSDPRGVWAGTLALCSIIVLGLATSIPFRPALSRSRVAGADTGAAGVTVSADAAASATLTRARRPTGSS